MTGCCGGGAQYDSGMGVTRFPTSIAELAQHLAEAPGPSSEDQSRSIEGQVLDSREAVERFLADVEDSRRADASSA